MKSIIIRDNNGKLLYHFKYDKKGVISKIATELSVCSSATVILHDGSRINFPIEKGFKKKR
jgi:hypothetical protein